MDPHGGASSRRRVTWLWGAVAAVALLGIAWPWLWSSYRVHNAKAWGEQLAFRMLEQREAVEADPGLALRLSETLDMPWAFLDEHNLGWTFHEDGLTFELGTVDGQFVYDTRTDAWTKSSDQPYQLVEATLSDGT